MTEQHIMIDLETLSTRTTASIVSIGAVKFDPHGDDRLIPPDSGFYVRLRPETNHPQFHVDADTIAWWLRQSEKTRLEFSNKDSVGIEYALQMFYKWVRGDQPFDVSEVIIWSHEGFDYPILQHAYDVFSMTAPFMYRSGRDIRTIIHAAFGRNLDVEEEVEGFPKNPNPHHPVYDAWHQAIMVQECFRRLGKA